MLMVGLFFLWLDPKRNKRSGLTRGGYLQETAAHPSADAQLTQT